MTVYETDIPGVGRKFELDAADGSRVVVLLHHDGRVDLFRREHEDADSEKLFEFDNRTANRLGSILEGAYFETVDLDDLSVPLGDAIIEWYEISEGSMLAGATLGETDLRAETGASIIAIRREDKTIPNPDPETALSAGDVLVALGTREQQAALDERV